MRYQRKMSYALMLYTIHKPWKGLSATKEVGGHPPQMHWTFCFGRGTGSFSSTYISDIEKKYSSVEHSGERSPSILSICAQGCKRSIVPLKVLPCTWRELVNIFSKRCCENLHQEVCVRYSLLQDIKKSAILIWIAFGTDNYTKFGL